MVMGMKSFFYAWAASLWLLLAALWPASAFAQSPADVSTVCEIRTSLDRSIKEFATPRSGWTCGDDRKFDGSKRSIIRFPIAQGGAALPQYLVSQTSRFDRVQIMTIDRDGSQRIVSRPYEAMIPSAKNREFYTPLPAVGNDTEYIYVAIDNTSLKITLAQMYLRSDIPGSRAPERQWLLLLAMLCGMLLMPLGFDAAVFKALKQPFVIWHGIMATFVLAQIMLVSGVAVALFHPTIEQMRIFTLLSFGAMIASAGVFGATFIERDRLAPYLRHLLIASAIWVALATTMTASGIFPITPLAVKLYLGSFIPVMLLYGWTLLHALRRGSRAARYQLAGWIPMAGVGIIRVLSGLTPLVAVQDAIGLFYVATIIEVFATALGIADRLVTIRRQRDNALVRASELGSLSNTDPLTGLMNRRALEQRFDELQAEGFDTLAVLDLDHFKSVNDRFGHAVGDAVLQAVGTALTSDTGRQSVAVRLGGEEFVLFMKGNDAAERADKLRRAIPVHVARDVPDLDRLVSASMGVVQAGVGIDRTLVFAELYKQADRLLYEAKRSGRNRTLHEKTLSFAKPQDVERVAA